MHSGCMCACMYMHAHVVVVISHHIQGLIRGRGGGRPGISPKTISPPPPTRIFTIKNYINGLSYVLNYSNGDKEQHREGKVEAIAAQRRARRSNSSTEKGR